MTFTLYIQYDIIVFTVCLYAICDMARGYGYGIGSSFCRGGYFIYYVYYAHFYFDCT